MKASSWGWGFKLFIMLVIFASLPVAALGVLWAGTMRDTFERATLEGVAALANTKAEAIDQFTEDRTSGVERIASLVAPPLASVLEASEALRQVTPEPDAPLPALEDGEELGTEPPAKKPLPSPPNEQEEGSAGSGDARRERLAANVKDTTKALRHTLALVLWDQQRFEELIVMDAGGKVLASTFAVHEGRTAAELAYFQGGRAATYLAPVFTSPLTERLTMLIATPIRNEHAEVIGVLGARLNLKRFFRLINDTTGLGNTGETMVARRTGDTVTFMAPTRHDPDAALRRTVALGDGTQRGLQNAARGQRGMGVNTDYRGQCVFSAWEYIPALEWGLVTKIDCEEALEPVAGARTQMLLVALLVLALALLASLVASRAFVTPLKQLKDAADRISRGDFAVQIEIRSRDEIGQLADSFERMVAATKFFREQSHKEGDDDGPETNAPDED
jgi:HAMP domain-containing protein